MSNIVLEELLRLRERKEDQIVRLSEDLYKIEESAKNKKHFISKLKIELEEIESVLNLINNKKSEY